MASIPVLRSAALLTAALLPMLGCPAGPEVPVDTEDGSSGSTSPPGTTTSMTTATSTCGTECPGTSTMPPTVSDSGTTTDPGTDSSTGGSGTAESTGTTGTPQCEPGDPGCNQQLDILFVIDNSGTMGEEQLNLAQAFPLLVEQLHNLTNPDGVLLAPDVQVMVTTTDFGNPLCTPFEPPGYDPAQGSPISTACVDRLQDFTNLTGSFSIPEACTDLCPVAVTPADPFVAFDGDGSNVAGMPVDIDGDGVPDSPEAQALACIGPQGINGCGFESPLENMLQALNPAAAWNTGGTPFLRDDATLGIVLVTDEADCSILDFSIMEDAALQNINPNTGMPAPSSAICWNAGVTCMGPDAMGVYSSCDVGGGGGLQPLTRYTNYLIDELRDNQGKEVVMLAVAGVPLVTEYEPDPPFLPTAGGIFDLQYRNWIDGQYPVGDILPAEFAGGTTAADKQFQFGIGPGCTGQNAFGDFTGQAIPPVRIRDVCQALDLDGTSAGARCCIDSVCNDDYSSAMQCFTGLLGQTVPAPAPE